MYWTTPTVHLLPSLRSPPLESSSHEYLFALRAFTTLLEPLSAQLLPLLTVYVAARATQSFSPTYPFSLDEHIRRAEVEELNARVVLLCEEMRAHYEEFCYIYGEKGVAEVREMVGELSERERWSCAHMPRQWNDVRFLMGRRGW
jgi:hypothetical protein